MTIVEAMAARECEMTMTPKTVEELLDWWPGNIPFKGKLISDDGCMCAQGQALHFLGGYSADDLCDMEQSKADAETARLFGISRTHAVLLRLVNDKDPGAPTCVIREPGKVLGDQAQRVLAFWRHLDRMTAADWWEVAAAWDAAGVVALAAARAAAWATAGAAAGAAARDAAWDAAWDAAGVVARVKGGAAWATAGAAARDAARDAAWATSEIQGAAVMRERGQPFAFLPMFGFAEPEALDEVAA